MKALFQQNFYKDLNKEQVAKMIREEGFNPILIQNKEGDIYPKHQHPERKLLAFLKGEMVVKVEGKSYHCRIFDRLFIPGDTEHEAVVGSGGCIFFWSEKL